MSLCEIKAKIEAIENKINIAKLQIKKVEDLFKSYLLDR